MEETRESTLLTRASALALVPILLTLALPLALLFVAIVYLLAVIHGVRLLIFSAPPEKQVPELQKPHFLDIDVSARVVSDETTKG